MARRPRAPEPVRPSRLSLVGAGVITAAPAAFLPGALDRFVFPKLAVAAVGVALVLAARGTGRLPRSVVITVGAASVVLVVAALTSAAPLAQLVGRAPRFEGVVGLAAYAGCLAAGARAGSATKGVVLRTTVVVAVLVAVLGIVEATGAHPLATTASRPGSLLGNATDQGAYGVLVTGLCLPTALRDRWAQVGVVAGVTAAITSASRGALLGLLVALAVVVVASPRLRRPAAVVTAAAVVAAFAVPLTRRRILLESPLSHATISGRRTEWHEALVVWVHHPLLGVGPSGFVDAYPKVQSAGYVARYGSATLDSPHDVGIQALLAGGPLLLAAGLVLVVLVARAVRRSPDPLVLGVGAALAGYLAVVLTHFTSPATTPWAAFLGGLVLAEPLQRRAFQLSAATVGAVVSAVAAVALVIAAAAEVPLRLGERALARGDVATAASDLRTAHDLRPWDVDLDAEAAEALSGAGLRGTAGASAAAAPFLARAYPHLAGDARVQLARAGVLLARDDLPGALSALDRAHVLAPRDVEVVVARGVLRQQAGDLRGAVTDLTAATVLDPHDAQPWRLLAAADSAVGDQAGAAAATAVAQRLGG